MTKESGRTMVISAVAISLSAIAGVAPSAAATKALVPSTFQSL